MIVVLSSRTDVTSDFVVDRLREFDAEFVRFNTDELLREWRLTWSLSGWHAVDTCGTRIESSAISAVYYRRPQDPQPLDGTAATAAPFIFRETRALLQGLYATTKAEWISRPEKIRIAEDKLYQLTVARNLGFIIPETLVTHDVEAARRFCDGRSVIVKPLSCGLLSHEPPLLAYCEEVHPDWDFGDVELCPHLFQQRITKTADIRVTVVDDEVFACRIFSQAHATTELDWRRASSANIDLPHEIFELDPMQARLCRLIVATMGLRFGAIDLVERADGSMVFLEINPNGQWAWVEQITGVPISSAIAKALIRG